MRAYVLLKLEPGSEKDIMRGLQELQPVIEASIIHGPYDCLVELRREDLESINDTVFQIREMEGVADTLTCLVTRSWLRTSK